MIIISNTSPICYLYLINCEAARLGLLNFPSAIERLQKTNFRASPRLLKLLLDRHEKEEKAIEKNA